MVSLDRAESSSGPYAVEFSRLDWYLWIKRAVDVALAACLGLVLLLPLFVVLAPILCWRGDILFCQERVGAGGRRFRCYKFRTMIPHAEHALSYVLARDATARIEWEHHYKLANDPRVTRLGRFLRRTGLDELPQLWNILMGDMSLVGPRPIVEDEISRYGIYFRHYASVRPGLTGMWQVCGRNRRIAYRRRVAMDVSYIRNKSLWLDCVLLARTVVLLLRSRRTAIGTGRENETTIYPAASLVEL